MREESGETTPRDESGERAGAHAGLLSTHRRFGSNVASGHRFLRARARRRRGAHPRIHGVRYAIVAAFVVAIFALVLDLPVGAYRNQWPDLVLRIGRDMTNFGKSGWILIPTGLAILVGYSLDWEVWGRRGRMFALRWMSLVGYIFFSIAGAGLITDLVKALVGRARPVHFQELGAFAFELFHGASYYSFPSGHSTTIGALFAAIALLYPLVRLPCLLLALWFGATRIIVGAHYPSDVAAGLAWGAWFAYFSAMLFARHGIIFTYGARGWPVRRGGYRLLSARRLRRLRRLVRRRG